MHFEQSGTILVRAARSSTEINVDDGQDIQELVSVLKIELDSRQKSAKHCQAISGCGRGLSSCGRTCRTVTSSYRKFYCEEEVVKVQVSLQLCAWKWCERFRLRTAVEDSRVDQESYRLWAHSAEAYVIRGACLGS